MYLEGLHRVERLHGDFQPAHEVTNSWSLQKRLRSGTPDCSSVNAHSKRCGSQPDAVDRSLKSGLGCSDQRKFTLDEMCRASGGRTREVLAQRVVEEP